MGLLYCAGVVRYLCVGIDICFLFFGGIFEMKISLSLFPRFIVLLLSFVDIRLRCVTVQTLISEKDLNSVCQLPRLSMIATKYFVAWCWKWYRNCFSLAMTNIQILIVLTLRMLIYREIQNRKKLNLFDFLC